MKIGIGIPCFDKPPVETTWDYMRMCYHFGRRMLEHDFFLITKGKSEQFRARNSIIQTALQFNLDYLLFLDDDHVFSWQGIANHDGYGFLEKLLEHDKDIVGCLYYHRTGAYKPVLMKRVNETAYSFMDDSEITGELQEVDVQGGGCMLINMRIFDKIGPPYFEPEMKTGEGADYGTDIQLCRKAQEAGFKVYCDTSIVVGHVKNEPEIVHGANRELFMAQNTMKDGMCQDWMVLKYVKDFCADVMEYTGLDWDDVVLHAIQYNPENQQAFHEYADKKDYYRNIGMPQLCRSAKFHSGEKASKEGIYIQSLFRFGFRGRGLDFGCGGAPVGFNLLRNGHWIDFVDVEGAYAYEFLKWRVEKHGLKNCGWKLGGPYDFLLFLDVIEHLEDWREVLDEAIGRLVPQGVLITNYFDTHDYHNREHINMDHPEVAKFLASRHMIPKGNMTWFKDDNFMGGAMNKRVEANGTDSNTSN